MTDNTANAKTEEVLNIVRTIIQEVVGDDIELLGPINLNTSFNYDLELESIELVAMAEKLQERFGDQVDFVNWMSKKSLDEIISLTVGQLVSFIVESIS